MKDNFASLEQTQPKASRQTLFVQNGTDCSIHELDFLVIMRTHKPLMFFYCYHGHHQFD